MKLHHQLTAYTGINSKRVKNLNLSCETVKILEENIGNKILDISCSTSFADTSRAREIKEKNKQMGLHQIKKFRDSKRNNQPNGKGTHCMGEHIFQ